MLVTGAGSGIGHEIALAAARAEHNVHAFVRTRRSSEIAALDDAGVRITVLDLSVPESVSLAFRDIAESNMPDVAIFAAGVAHLAPIERETVESIADAFQVNVFSVMQAVGALIPAMATRRSGRLVMLGSTAAFAATGPRLMSVYSASKSALRTFAADLNKELADLGIEVGMVTLATTDTPMVAQLLASAKEAHAQDPLTARYVTPRDLILDQLTTGLQCAMPASWVAEQVVAFALGSDSCDYELFLPNELRQPLFHFEAAPDGVKRRLARAGDQAEFTRAVQCYLSETSFEGT